MINPHRTYQTFPPQKKPMKSSMRSSLSHSLSLSLLVYLGTLEFDRQNGGKPKIPKHQKAAKRNHRTTPTWGSSYQNEMRSLGYAQVLRWKVPGANPTEILIGELSTWKTSCTLWYTGTLYASRYIPMP